MKKNFSSNFLAIFIILSVAFCFSAYAVSHANDEVDEKQKISISAKEHDEKLTILFSGTNNEFTHKFDDNKIVITFVEKTFIFNTAAISSHEGYVEEASVNGNTLTIQFHDTQPLNVRQIKLKGKTGIEIRKLKRNDNINTAQSKEIRKESLQISHSDVNDETQVKFEWDSYTASSVFIKDSKIWFVFNKPTQKMTIPDIVTQDISLTNFKFHKNNGQSTIISANFEILRKDYNIIFYKTGFSWNLKASKSQIKPKDMRVLSKPYAAPHPRVEVEFEDNSVKPIDVKDPDTGIYYKVVPSHESAIATLRKYGFVDFEVLQTIQGVAFQPRSDSLKLTLEDRIIRIEGAASLNIAPRVYNKRTEKFGNGFVQLNLEEFAAGYSSIVSLKGFEVKDDSFNKKIIKIRSLILKAHDDKKKKAQIYANLAIFYLANGFHKESLTILDIVKDLDHKLYNSYNIRLINAAAEFLSNYFNAAFEIVKNIHMVDVPMNFRKEVRFWKAITGYMVSGSGDHLKSADPMTVVAEKDINFLTEYNDKLIFEMLVAIVGDQIREHKYSKARQIFKVIKKLSIEANDINRLNGIVATFYAAVNKPDTAIEYWDTCIEDSTDLLNHVKCRYDKVNYLKDISYIKTSQYIDEMETLSYLWHGDELQIDTLKSLGQIYFDHGNFTKALRAWNKIVTYFPYTPDALSLSKTMGSTFVKFFLTDELTQKITHLDALSLFYEFENLVPIGDVGDEIVLKFIEHLRALDLLDRAIVLLKHQVVNRLYGYKKEEMVNVLTQMYIDNQEPAYALDALALGDSYKILPDYIGKDRKYLTAKAYHLNGDNKQAVKILENDYSIIADNIKADIYWSQKDWKKFSSHIEPKVYKIRYETKKLNTNDTESVLKLAISYLIGNEWKLLDDLYKDFKKRMPEGDRNTEIFLTLEQSWKTIREKTVEADKTIDMIQKTVDDIVSAINEKPEEKVKK